MTSKAMWEIDPETRSKLATLQREPANSICCDCSAPSPQWASPKFGIFICLVCAGVHRGLGVHISFVRSISMDAFKSGELERMRLGGNAAWQKFYTSHPDTIAAGLTWDSATIADRYSGDVGEEWKERLAAQVEARDFVPPAKKSKKLISVASPSPTSVSAPLSGTRDAPTGNNDAGSKTRVDDAYFARLGDANASRPEGLPPSQGGKYAGFGNTPASPSSKAAADLPTINDLQADPVAALTKGFGWFTTTVTKTAKTVNDGYIQPTARQIAESEQWKNAQTAAQTAAQQVARSAAVGARSAQDGFSRFVEGGPASGSARPRGYRQAPIDESKKDFWDSFASIADERNAPSSIGTTAMGGASKKSSVPPQKQDDDWDW